MQKMEFQARYNTGVMETRSKYVHSCGLTQ
jgi:hypothetical protein